MELIEGRYYWYKDSVRFQYPVICQIGPNGIAYPAYRINGMKIDNLPGQWSLIPEPKKWMSLK